MGGGADTNANWKKLASKKNKPGDKWTQKNNGHDFFASVQKVWKLKMPKGARLVLQISKATSL